LGGELRPGTRLTAFSSSLTVGEELGRGGEGIVYGIHDGSGACRYALKWYLPHVASPTRLSLLSYIIDRGAPSDRFLWPLNLLRASDDSTFGYLMELRPDGYVGLAALLRGRVERREGAVVRFGFELARSFLALHGIGLCYRDINFGNAFFEPVTGRALICDNDNVGIDGVSPTGVRGAPGFMAPEIVRGEALPSRVTDNYSLAVMLFYLLMVGHPLEGRRTWNEPDDPETRARFFGHEPIFIFDPDNDANRPVEGVHDHVEVMWNRFPRFFRASFSRVFTSGLFDPQNGRVLDSEWCDALARLLDLMWVCQACGTTSYVEPDEPGRGCIVCGAEPPGLIRIGSHLLVVSPRLRITKHHLNFDLDIDTPIAVASGHPTIPGRLGLRNVSAQAWNIGARTGELGNLEPGRSVELVAGLRIDLGSHVVRVERPQPVARSGG
jgi:DNA-binding helix-hairpin-helix protein with protein kinase domain